MTILSYAKLRIGANEPRLHGNGFLQLDLPDDTRLNIWHPDLLARAQTTRTPIHDHRFSFTSRVILGTQIHHEWTFAESKGDGNDYLLYTPQRRTGTEDTKLVPVSGVPYSLYDLGEIKVRSGDTYSFEYGCFHETHPAGFVATIMTKTHEEPTWTVRVACKVGEEPDNVFDREEVDKEWLWTFVEGALKYQHG